MKVRRRPVLVATMTDTSTDGRLPAGWREITAPDHIVEKYDPRTPTVFEFADAPVGVHVVPAEPVGARGDREWRVDVGHGRRDEFQHVDSFAHLGDREAALEVAAAFMQAFCDRTDLPKEERIELAIEDAKTG